MQLDDSKYKNLLDEISIHEFFMEKYVHKGITGNDNEDYLIYEDLTWEKISDFGISFRNLYIFLLVGMKKKTFAEVEKEMKLSNTRIRQIFDNTLKKFKHPKN